MKKLTEDMYDENRLGLIRTYWLGRNVIYLGKKCELVLENKEEFKVRGVEGDSLINGLLSIITGLKELNITSNVRQHITDVLEYLRQKYIDPENPPAYI